MKPMGVHSVVILKWHIWKLPVSICSNHLEAWAVWACETVHLQHLTFDFHCFFRFIMHIYHARVGSSHKWDWNHWNNSNRIETHIETETNTGTPITRSPKDSVPSIWGNTSTPAKWMARGDRLWNCTALISPPAAGCSAEAPNIYRRGRIKSQGPQISLFWRWLLNLSAKHFDSAPGEEKNTYSRGWFFWPQKVTRQLEEFPLGASLVPVEFQLVHGMSSLVEAVVDQDRHPARPARKRMVSGSLVKYTFKTWFMWVYHAISWCTAVLTNSWQRYLSCHVLPAFATVLWQQVPRQWRATNHCDLPAACHPRPQGIASHLNARWG